MSSYRVAILSSEYPPHIYGGLGVHVDQITAVIGGLAVCEVFVPEQGDYNCSNPNIHLLEVPVCGASTDVGYWLNFCKNAVKLANKSDIQVDVIHCHDWMTVMAGISLRDILRKPLVFSVHLPQVMGLRGCLENIGLATADLALVASEAVRRELISRHLTNHGIEIVPNGVNSSLFCPDPRWPEDGGYVLFVGRLVAQKGVDTLLRAFKAVLRRCPQSRLVVCGDGDLELYFKRVAHYLGFPHHVSFVEWKTGQALIQLYQQSQLVVVPSYYEPFGIVALEAMACGRPVLVSQTGGLQEIIDDGIQGYLAPVGNHLEFARHLVNLINSPKQRQEMGAAARIRAMEYSWEKAGRRMIELYSGLVGQSIIPIRVSVVNKLKAELLNEMGEEMSATIHSLTDWI